MVFFGCVSIEDESNKKEETEEVHVLEYEDIQRRVLSLRTKIIEGLNKSREVRDVSDLFVKLPSEFIFNPIVFKMHIPLSLQKMRYVFGESFRAEIEDFELVYDGYILMVVALCGLNKHPFGVFDVRDRFEKVLGSIVKVKIVPPCLSSVGVTFSMQDGGANKERKGLFFHITKPTDSRALLRELYAEVGYHLGMFYETCSLAHDISDKVEEIVRNESELLGGLRNFLETDWKQIRKKWSLVSQSKKNMADTLEKLFSYLSHQNLLRRRRRDVDRFIIQPNTSSAKLIKDMGLDFYTDPELTIDTDSVVKTVEHVRNEIESFGLNTSTFFSALVGAVVASIITLIASGLL